MRVHTKQQRAPYKSRVESAPSRAVGSPDPGAVGSPEGTGSRACVGACHSWHGPARSSPGTTDRPRAGRTSLARPHNVQRDKWSDPQPDRPRCGSQRIDGIEFGPLIGRTDVAHEPPGRLFGRIMPNIACPTTVLEMKVRISNECSTSREWHWRKTPSAAKRRDRNRPAPTFACPSRHLLPGRAGPDTLRAAMNGCGFAAPVARHSQVPHDEYLNNT